MKKLQEDTPTIRVVCAVIVDDRGRILAAKRPRAKSLPHKWEFPGGKIDAFETEIDALLREIKEELDVEIAIIERLKQFEYRYEFGCITLIPYYSQIAKGKLRAVEHEDLQWVEVALLDSLDWADADCEIVRFIMGSVVGQKWK